MAEVIKRLNRSSDEIYIDRTNKKIPFKKDTHTYVHRYIVDTDFTSGDNLRLDIDGAQKVLYATAKTPSNTFLTIAETDLATETSDVTRQGVSLTLGTSTTDVQINITVEI